MGAEFPTVPEVNADSLRMEIVWNSYGKHMAPNFVRIEKLTVAAIAPVQFRERLS
jgi:hypothetical protein